jgi:predicted outer membrane protein
MVTGCGMSPTAPSPMASQTGAPFTRAYVIVGSLTDLDRTFITFAAQAYQAQITLGQLAETRGDTALVKSFGRQMQQDAAVALASLREMTPRDVPTTITLNTQQAGWVTTLQGLSGSDLDRRYIQFMLVEYTNNITQFPLLTASANSGLKSHAADYILRQNGLIDYLNDLARRVGLTTSL